MKKVSIILMTLTLWLVASCSAGGPYDGPYIAETISLTGLVTDEEENPINHIRIFMEWDSPFSPIAVYSSANGIFQADLDFSYIRYPLTISLEISDIDGHENGGEFETRTDTITLLERSDINSPLSSIIYRLTRATASENSPQSL